MKSVTLSTTFCPIKVEGGACMIKDRDSYELFRPAKN